MTAILSRIAPVVFSLAAAAVAADETITAEPLFFTGDTKAAATARLLREPVAAPRLESSDGAVQFENGRDFTWERGTRVITLTAESRVPFTPSAALYLEAKAPGSWSKHRNSEKWMLYAPGRKMHDLQAHAAYVTRDDWRLPPTASAPAEQLGALRGKLAAHQPLKVVVLGDSISTGADASALADAAPRQRGYPDLVARGIEFAAGAKVTLVNLSKGGMDSKWGAGRVADVLAEKPDIFIVAFGMNDASGRRAPEEFAAVTRTIFEPVRKELPGCSVILVSPMTANEEWSAASPDLYPKYATALGAMTGPGVALADVTSVWSAISERKKHMDLSGNGLNHPNDYGHRVYANTILAVINQ